jgi:hypothetical protein
VPLLADAQDAFRLMQRSSWTWVALAVVLVLLAAVVFWIRSRFREDSGPAADDDEMLRLASELRRQGDLSDEEFRSLKGRLLDRDPRGTNAPSPVHHGPNPLPPNTDEEADSPRPVSADTPSKGDTSGETT